MATFTLALLGIVLSLIWFEVIEVTKALKNLNNTLRDFVEEQKRRS